MPEDTLALNVHDLRRIIDTQPSEFTVDKDILVNEAKTPVFTHTWRWNDAIDGQPLELVVTSEGESQETPHGTLVEAHAADFALFLGDHDVTPDSPYDGMCAIYLEKDGQRTAGLRLSCSLPF